MFWRSTFSLVLVLAQAALAAPVRTEHVDAELIAEHSAAEPGKTFTVALRLKIIPHWHTYWRNPGDSGEPTSLEWRLPAGWSAGAIQWPTPRRLPAGPLMNFGYENEVLHLVDIAVPADASHDNVLAARASWLVCNPERCIPESADLAIAVPLGTGNQNAHAAEIATARALLPIKADGWRVTASKRKNGVELAIILPEGMAADSVSSLGYFPFEQGKMQNAAGQSLVREGSSLILTIPAAEQPVGLFTRVHGLLAANGLTRAVEIDAPVSDDFVRASVPGLSLALLFAFAGGLMLNLMPCVLPVLSIKILSFAGGKSRAGARKLGILYALGVVLSFLFLAALLILLKSLGQEIGWGFQLQSSIFAGLLALLFLTLALNLSGVFEISTFLPARLAGVGSGDGRADAFFSGVLAVAVASPCTAPFMGAALGYALSSRAAETFAIFIALGAGMALPYLILSWSPRLTGWLPRPGPWMIHFKRLLAIPLYATVLWLGWVLGIQLGAFSNSSQWEPYSEQGLAAYLRQDKTVFVDYTAAWCVTCQVNKRLVLARPEVEQALRQNGIARMRADWTKRDVEISRALAALGRNGVPVYAIYRRGREPELLPEVLTRDMVLTASQPPKETTR